MAQQRSVTLAGKDYDVRYRLSEAHVLDQKLGRGRTIQHVLQEGQLIEKATLVWFAIKDANRKLTPRAVLEMFERHVELGGEWDVDVYFPCVRAAFAARFFGAYNDEEIDRMMADLGEPDREGKGTPAPPTDPMRA